METIQKEREIFKNSIYARKRNLSDSKTASSLLILVFAFIGLVNCVQAQTASDFRAAAEQGDAWAQFNLAICYENGYGIEKDLNTCLYWFEKAIKNENGSLDQGTIEKVKGFIKTLKEHGCSSTRTTYSSEDKYLIDMLKAEFKEMQKELPFEIDEGITMISCDFIEDSKTLEYGNCR